MNLVPELRVIILLLPALLGIGCAAPLPALDGKLSTLDDYRQGKAQLDVEIQDWDKRFTPVKGEVEFSIVHGTDAGATVAYSTVSNGDKTWTMSLQDHATFNWRLDDGGFVCTTNIDVPSGTTSTFTPPLPVIPHDLKPGEAFTAKGDIVVHDTAPPAKRVASGTWTVSIVHDADVTLRFGDTNYDCTRIKTVYVADLGLATVKRTAFDFYAPDSGWVCQVFEQTVTKLIIPETTTGTWIIH
jgi:hypothetical protein